MKIKLGKLIFVICLLSISFLLISCDKYVETISTLEDLSELKPVITSNQVKLSDIEEMMYRNSITGLNGIVVEDFVNYKIKYKVGKYYVYGLISAPADYLEKEYPILIYNRGGYIEDGKNTFSRIQAMAAYGFIVLASQYRGVDGGTGTDEFGGAEIDDIIKIVDIAEMFTFRSDKIFMYGLSRGSVNTYRVLQKDHRVTAACVGGGITNFTDFFNARSEEAKQPLINALGGRPDEVPEEYQKRSAVLWASDIKTPLLILHGSYDSVVSVDQAKSLYNIMNELGKDVEMITYDGGHNLTNEMNDYLFAWFLR